MTQSSLSGLSTPVAEALHSGLQFPIETAARFRWPVAECSRLSACEPISNRGLNFGFSILGGRDQLGRGHMTRASCLREARFESRILVAGAERPNVRCQVQLEAACVCLDSSETQRLTLVSRFNIPRHHLRHYHLRQETHCQGLYPHRIIRLNRICPITSTLSAVPIVRSNLDPTTQRCLGPCCISGTEEASFWHGIERELSSSGGVLSRPVDREIHRTLGMNPSISVRS